MPMPRDVVGMMLELLGAQGPGAFDTKELRRFLQGAGASNHWMELGPYSAYLRRSRPRNVGDGAMLRRPIDLASINNKDLPTGLESATNFQPAGRRHPKGRFRELMQILETEAEAAGHDSIYVENIMNEFLPQVLESMGYLRSKGNDVWEGIPSMYRRLGVQSGDRTLGRNRQR